MVGKDERRFAEWLDLTADLVRCPGRAFPRTLVSEMLRLLGSPVLTTHD